VRTAVGSALIEQLERRFVTTVDRVQLGGEEIELLRPRSAEDLISETDFEEDERLPYWAEIWPSALVLAHSIDGEEGRGRTMLELGCGIGLVTLAAARAGYDVLATDYYQDALLFTRANGWRSSGTEPRTRLVDWRALPGDLGTFDRIVASDVLYERPYAELVAKAMGSTLAPDGRATVADPGRIAAEAFLEACASAALLLLRTETVPFEMGAIRQTIRLHHLGRDATGPRAA
jgi:predicted nicotinamide N-methyase